MKESARPATIVRGSGSPRSTVELEELVLLRDALAVRTTPTRRSTVANWSYVIALARRGVARSRAAVGEARAAPSRPQAPALGGAAA